MDRYNSKNNIFNKNFFEKALIFFIIILSFTLFITQIGLVSDYIRPYLTDLEVFEGHYINEVDSLIKKGKIAVQLVNMNNDKDIKILVNGMQESQFDENIKEIIVKNKSVVEIDGSKIESPIKVRIKSKSDNIKSDIVNKEIEVTSNIKILCHIKID